MNKTDDGWPLFRWDTEPATECRADAAVTLRDYFAARAMQAALTAGHDEEMRGHEGWRDEFARESYRFADAMLKAREAKP